ILSWVHPASFALPGHLCPGGAADREIHLQNARKRAARGSPPGMPPPPHPVVLKRPGAPKMTHRSLAPTALFRALLIGALMTFGIACGAPAGSAQKAAPPAPSREPANVMGFEHADWLEREGRAELEKPEMVIQ